MLVNSKLIICNFLLPQVKLDPCGLYSIYYKLLCVGLSHKMIFKLLVITLQNVRLRGTNTFHFLILDNNSLEYTLNSK